MSTYIESEVKVIQKRYCHLFPTICEELKQFWYDPKKQYAWSYLATPFHTVPHYSKFSHLCDDLKRLQHQISNDLQPDVKVIGSRLADLAKRHDVGYSIGLNPWADYLLHSARPWPPKEVVVIVGNNWYPFVTRRNKIPQPPKSPLCKDDPYDQKYDQKKYKFIFEPFLKDSQRPLVFFTNIFPQFIDPGPANKGVSKEARNYIVGTGGMKNGLVKTLESINPDIKLIGLVTFGKYALEQLSPTTNPTTNLGDIVREFQKKLESHLDNVLPPFVINKDKIVPWLPFYHPAARELRPTNNREKYEETFSVLAKALLKRGRSNN